MIYKEEETVGSGSPGRSHKQEQRKADSKTPISFKKKEERGSCSAKGRCSHQEQQLQGLIFYWSLPLSVKEQVK